jgi:hypothetical protein
MPCEASASPQVFLETRKLAALKTETSNTSNVKGEPESKPISDPKILFLQASSIEKPNRLFRHPTARHLWRNSLH